jgi:hypothetical protein
VSSRYASALGTFGIGGVTTSASAVAMPAVMIPEPMIPEPMFPGTESFDANEEKGFEDSNSGKEKTEEEKSIDSGDKRMELTPPVPVVPASTLPGTGLFSVAQMPRQRQHTADVTANSDKSSTSGILQLF